MNIVFLTYLNINYPGGGHRVFYPLATKLANLGHTVRVISTDNGESTTNIASLLSEKGIDVDTMPTLHRTTVPRDISFLRDSFRRCDVVYMQYWPRGMEFSALMCSWVTGTPVIAAHYGHLTNAKYDSRLVSHISERILGPRNIKIGKHFKLHHVICKNDYLDVTRYVTPTKVVFLPLGVQNNSFKKRDKFKTFTLFMLSRLVEDKGILLLPFLMKGIQAKIPSFRLYVAGSGNLESFVANMAKADDRIIFLGEITEETKRDMLEQSHVLLAPSSYESFMLTGVEAMSAYTPVIIFDIPGPRDYIRDGHNGFIARDVSDFASKIIELFDMWKNDSKSYEVMLANCRKTAEKYDWDNSVMPAFERMLQRSFE